ncbi:alpha/beta hydrolase [Limosilactobacillus reuteri]|uniref:alpha/beta hydrolase n=1 Tax=Limosilactobacillus reuteri TaxID=1598 RepID=UPI001E6197B2|nr:alpha/beta hydrolase [Limosilactobacillus reuteri]MCC4325499.1 alpha/beta hydrolase [Limosilactobacillus reuteri]MCC4329218.1 alpha/beta hydrolase [Limosilactobacillus reuteri]MCC4352693.1 alpha/beta hydrolase [Limosilactobacillus reuteri]MCC4377481.1 alpha/beta hydrolase [Limosilactobacillus reuteri]
MKKYYQLLLALIIIVASLLGGNYKVHAVTHYVQSSTPTIFVHGWGSSSHAEEKMANAARDAGVTKTIVRANVDKKGKVTFNRPIPANAVNPIVEVNLEDNKLSAYRDNYTQGYHHGGEYVKNVVLALEKQHHYKQINLVGHSMGNLEIINYINDNVNDKSLPQVAHLVAIAGHYNGLVGQSETQNAKINPKTGEPEKMDSAYHELLGLRQIFPKNTAVLNIYGDVGGGSHSDEDVPVNSAKSLKYLVSDRAKSYREVEIHGKNAQHSKLHNNSQVNRELIKFLWEESN